MTSGVYTIVNRINLKLYVGSSADIEKRWKYHQSHLVSGCHPNRYLQRAWSKYGAEAFVFSTIDLASKETLITREQIWIDGLGCLFDNWGYNISPTAANSFGCKRTAETRAKIAAATRRQMADPNKKWPLKPKTKGHPDTIAFARMGGLSNKGKRKSDSTKAKIAAKLMGHAVSDETRRKISAAKRGKPSPQKGVKRRPEVGERMRNALRARTPEQIAEWKAKLSEATKKQMSDPAARSHLSGLNAGKTMPEETKQKIRAALKGRPVHENSRRALAEILARRSQSQTRNHTK